MVIKISNMKSLNERMDEAELDKLISDVKELKSTIGDSPYLDKLEKKLKKMKKDKNLDVPTMDYTGKMIDAFGEYKYYQKLASRD